MKINCCYPGQVPQRQLQALTLGHIFQRLDLALYVGRRFVCIKFSRV